MSMNSAFHHLFTICTTTTFQREINASGEPTTQVITNWDAARGTPLVRGEPQETSTGLHPMCIAQAHLLSS